MHGVESEWISGPIFVAWLAAEGIITRPGSAGRHWERQVRDWRDGRAVRVWTVDQFLIDVGANLGQVPSEVYCEAPQRSWRPPVSDSEKAQIVNLAQQGLSFAEIGRELDVTPKTIARHAKAGLAVAA